MSRVENENFSSYLEYNRILRTWLVAFGIGGPALLIVNEELISKLSSQGELRWLATVFFIGVALQVVGAMINKHTNWLIYLAECDDKHKDNFWCKTATWLGERLWLDVLFDVISMVAFVYAVWIMIRVFG